jgi:hypothetical protein
VWFYKQATRNRVGKPQDRPSLTKEIAGAAMSPL